MSKGVFKFGIRKRRGPKPARTNIGTFLRWLLLNQTTVPTVIKRINELNGRLLYNITARLTSKIEFRRELFVYRYVVDKNFQKNKLYAGAFAAIRHITPCADGNRNVATDCVRCLRICSKRTFGVQKVFRVRCVEGHPTRGYRR